MFEKAYVNMNQSIAPRAELVDRVLAAAREKPAARPVRCRRIARRLVLAAALVLCLSVAVPTLAAGSPHAFYSIMYAISPKAAQFFTPVQKASEDNGVRMEVVSADIRGERADIVIALTDLTGDRVDETTDLYDSYSINRPYDGVATCSRIGFDPETKTVTFLAQIVEQGANAREGDKITFTLSCFLSGKKTGEDVPIPIDWANVPSKPETQYMEYGGYAGMGADDADIPDGGTVLVPGESRLSPFDGFTVSAVGFVEGRLHVQLYIPDKLTLDDHASLRLVNASGQALPCTSISFRPTGSDNVPYQEYVFPVSEGETEGLALYGTFYKSGQITEGDWRVTFPLTMAEPQEGGD